MGNHWAPPGHDPSQFQQQQPFGAPPPPPGKKKSGLAKAGIAIVLLFGSCIALARVGANASKTTTSASIDRVASAVEIGEVKPARVQPNPDPPGSFRDGTRVVGEELAPGTYRTTKASPGCYWARLSGFSGEMNELLANENESGPAIVTIGKADKGFESQRCGLWVPGLSAITESPTAPFGDGTYVVGTDIAPGTWRADSPDDCYWARLRGFSGGMRDLIANENGRGIVTIAASDKGFRSERCGTWTKVK